jgi:hypothetical protein
MIERYNNLLRKVSEKYGIQKGNKEDEVSYAFRIFYSIISQMAYASLWDTDDIDDSCSDQKSISINHFSHRIESLVQSYREMYPEINEILSANPNYSFSEDLRNIYQNSGAAWHSGFRLAPAAFTQAKAENLIFYRSQPLSDVKRISGSGTYDFTEGSAKDFSEFRKQFLPFEENPVDFWKRTSEISGWKKTVTDNLEFLKTSFSNGDKYKAWSEYPDADEISIAIDQKTKAIYLYRFDGTKLFTSELPDWMWDASVWKILACGKLITKGTYPKASYLGDGSIVYLEIKYAFPAGIQNLLKMYSWPGDTYRLKYSLLRIMSTDVFRVLKDLLESMGYSFQQSAVR